MAATFVDFDANTPVGRKIARGLQMLRESRDVIRDALGMMNELSDGNRNTAGDFDLLAVEGAYQAGDYGTANAAALASYQELNSLYAKLSTDASVSNVAAAITQAAARHGV